MKALLLHPNRDFDVKQGSPPGAGVLRQDMELDTLLKAMAGDDQFLFDIAYKVLLPEQTNEVETILYRQEIVRDCLKNADVVKGLYALSVQAIEAKKKSYWSSSSRHPSSILYGGGELLRALFGILEELRRIADACVDRFESKGLGKLLSLLRNELGDEYLAGVRSHLRELKFDGGVLLSAELGLGNAGTNYVLREHRGRKRGWIRRILGRGSSALTYRVADRDEAGARALGVLRDRGINLVANAVAQSTDHIVGFFENLRVELAFYVACLNLHETLKSIGAPISLPKLGGDGVHGHVFRDLFDVCLALRMGRAVVGNTLNLNDKRLVVITGANQGGKSTFLRSIGLAQLMMQSGMFVAAETFVGEPSSGLFSHYKREEDATTKGGRLDEELGRLSDIAGVITPGAILLCNESFASTNEREGSEIARQIVIALLEKGIKVFFVTHLYAFARGFFEHRREDAVFLRAERKSDGTRTFRVIEGEPLETSYGKDLYEDVFPLRPKESSRVNAVHQTGRTTLF